MKSAIEQKIITGGFGLALFVLSGVSVISYLSLIGVHPATSLPNPMLTVAIGNSLSLMLFGWVYFLLRRAIANQGQLQQALRESQQQLETMLNNSPAVICLKDIQGRYLMLNRQLERLTGLNKTEIVGSTDYDIFPKEIAEQFQASDQAVLQVGECLEQEQVLPDNYTLITSKCPLYDPTGKAYAICCVSSDISDRKRAEQERVSEAAHSEHRFFNLSLDMLAIANYDGYFTHLNPAWEQTLGFTLEELKAQPFIEFIHPVDVEATQTQMEKLRVGFCVTQFENRYRCKDTSYKWLSWTSVAFLEEGLIYGVARDLSDAYDELRLRKQAEAALRKANEELEIRVEERTAYLRKVNDELLAEIVERWQVELALRHSESLYRTLVETIPHGIEEVNATGIITFGNSALHRMLGYARKELLGKRIWDLIPDSDRLTFPGHLARLVQEQPPPTPYLGTALTKDGNVLDIQVDWDYKRDEQGRVTGFVAVVTDITEPKQAQEALRVSEERLRTALKAAHMGTWDWNILTGQITWSTHFEGVWDRAAGSFNSSSYDSFITTIHSEDCDRVLQNVKRVLSTGEDYEDKFRVVLPNGNIRWLASIGQVFYDETGRPVRMTGLDLDVTERKIAEEARQKTEELYHTMTSNFPNGAVVLFDQDLRYTLAEGKELAAVGLSKESMEGNTIWEALPPETCEVIEPAYRAALDDRETVFETTYNDRIFLVQVLPVKNEQGEIFAGMSMLQDITESKRSEQALLEERNFVSAILDIAAALIVVCDRQGRFIRVNRACEQITGYSIDEMKGKYIWDLFLIPEEVKPVKRLVRKLQSGRFPNEHDNYWVMRDGNRRLISWSNTVLLDADSSVKYIVSVGIDITDRKRTEEIRRALEREQELSELRLRFFSMASHEFRTPLSTILLTAQILESSAHEWSTQKRLRNIRRISSAAKSMTQLLNDILTINRAETGKLELNYKSLDLEKICQFLLKEIQLNAGPQYTLTFSSQGNCQKALIDEKMLRSILTNLLTNAIKYSPDGGEVHLALTCEQGKASFQVRDQGIGIALSDQPHLFEAFHRGENIENIPGSGLGLTVVKKCVDLHGGKISVSSEVGVGTTFSVTLPVR